MATTIGVLAAIFGMLLWPELEESDLLLLVPPKKVVGGHMHISLSLSPSRGGGSGFKHDIHNVRCIPPRFRLFGEIGAGGSKYSTSPAFDKATVGATGNCRVPRAKKTLTIESAGNTSILQRCTASSAKDSGGDVHRLIRGSDDVISAFVAEDVIILFHLEDCLLDFRERHSKTRSGQGFYYTGLNRKYNKTAQGQKSKVSYVTSLVHSSHLHLSRQQCWMKNGHGSENP